MPAYNAEETIAESVDSVIAQTYTNWELIIIDDCSDIPVKFDNSKVKVIRNGTNQGVAYSRNSGVALAKGEYIAFLDSDDCWEKDKLERQLAFMKEKNAQISYTASAFFGSDYILTVPEILTYGKLLRKNLMSCSSVMAKRELLLKYPFPLRRNTHEDFVSWVRIIKEVGMTYGLNAPLLKYRRSENSKSSSRIKSALMTYNAYRELGYSVLLAMVMTARYAMWSITKWQRING
jgi:teichuronic acid biosynthesis glycosyltransferase TuaG